MAATRCVTCGRAVVPASGGEDVVVGAVRARIDGPASWTCPEGHGGVQLDPDAAAAELVAAFTPASRGRFRRGLRCGHCGVELTMGGRRTVRSVTVTDAGAPATTVTVDVPLLRCPDDATESIPPEVVDDLRDAVAAATRPRDVDPDDSTRAHRSIT